MLAGAATVPRSDSPRRIKLDTPSVWQCTTGTITCRRCRTGSLPFQIGSRSTQVRRCAVCLGRRCEFDHLTSPFAHFLMAFPLELLLILRFLGMSERDLEGLREQLCTATALTDVTSPTSTPASKYTSMVELRAACHCMPFNCMQYV